jgi:hypothetical protein
MKRKLLISLLQKLQVVAVPRESYGKFYDGDAYIVYCATPYGQPGGHSMKVGHIESNTITITITYNRNNNNSKTTTAKKDLKSLFIKPIAQWKPLNMITDNVIIQLM